LAQGSFHKFNHIRVLYMTTDQKSSMFFTLDICATDDIIGL